MGVAWYVDRSSLNVEKYAPPEYVIEVNVVTADSAIGDEWDFYSGGQGKITDVRIYWFYYNWNTKRMYQDQNGNLSYIDPWGPWASTGVTMPAGEMAFYPAYNLKFYGTMNIISHTMDRFQMTFTRTHNHNC